MVHEAIVNALKHGEPSRVAVTVDSTDGQITVIVADDGQGFPFRGRYDHKALAEMQSGPKSLLERVTSLGGRLSIESTDAGSRVEMILSGI
jgi:signal transduction histidine kinase